MDTQLHFTQKGMGKPLILLHGNGEDSGYFTHQIEFFSKDYRVIAVDTRGHGQSPRGNAPFTLRQFAEDLRSFMDRMGIEKASLLGFSDGGNIALLFAMKYPDRVERLILNGANLTPRGVKLRVQLPIEIGYRLASLFARKAPAAKRKAELLGLMVKEPNIAPEELASVRVPTLVIAGTGDMIKHRHTLLICQSLPNGQAVFISGSHFIAGENPEAFNRAVQNFLQQEDGKAFP